MIRQLIIIFFASNIVCLTANSPNDVGAILDKICSKRAAIVASARIEKDKTDKIITERNDDTEDDTEDDMESKADGNTNLNRNINRKMYYGVRRFFGDESDESADESGNGNTNINYNANIKQRRSNYRRTSTDEPPKEVRRRMMNGLRRKLSKY